MVYSYGVPYFTIRAKSQVPEFLPTYLNVFDQSMLVISTYFGHFDVDKRADRWPIPAMFTSYVSISFPEGRGILWYNLMVLVPSKPALQATRPWAGPREGARNKFFGELTSFNTVVYSIYDQDSPLLVRFFYLSRLTCLAYIKSAPGLISRKQTYWLCFILECIYLKFL